MQILFPGSLPLIFVFKLGILMLALVIGIILLYLGLRTLKRRINQKYLGYTFLLTSVFLFYFVISNFVNYTTTMNEWDEKYVGTFVEENYNEFLELGKENIWKSNSKIFSCESGKWEHIETEDFFYLELSCAESGHPKMQIFDTAEDTIIFKNAAFGHPDTNTRMFIRQKN